LLLGITGSLALLLAWLVGPFCEMVGISASGGTYLFLPPIRLTVSFFGRLFKPHFLGTTIM